VQRENTRRYVKGEKYKAYKAQYYEAVKARRRLARIGDVLAISSTRPGAEV
jgi:ribosomal protein S17